MQRGRVYAALELKKVQGHHGKTLQVVIKTRRSCDTETLPTSMKKHFFMSNKCFKFEVSKDAASSKHRIPGFFQPIEHPGEAAILACSTDHNASVAQLRTINGRKVSCNMKLASLQETLKRPLALGFRTSGCSTLPEKDLLNKGRNMTGVKKIKYIINIRRSN